MTDQTTPTTVSTLADHVAVTDAVVEQLAAHAVRLHHGNGQYSGVPRYVADEIGQAVLALVPDGPDELTPVQYALLDAVKDVALAPEAPAAKYATEQLARLAGEAFGYPLPQIVREGGLASFFYGRPVVTNPPSPSGTAPVAEAVRKARASGGPVDPKCLSLVGEHTAEVQTFPGRVTISREQAVELGLRPAIAPEDEAEPWPFKPGDVVRDSGEEADHGAWLDAAPDGVVLADCQGDHWKRDGTAGWWCTLNEPASTSHLTSHDLEASWGPLTVVSVPDPQEACTDDAPAGDA